MSVRISIVLVAVAALCATILAALPALGQDGPRVVRIDGADRYATAANVSRTFPVGVERVFLATGEDYPDALAATAVAGQWDYPILLVRSDEIPSATRDALERLDPAGITILGGTRAVGGRVEQQAAAFTEGPVDRLEGADRFATAAAIVDEYVDAGVPVVYVATGQGYADALAGGPAAVVDGGPILLVTRDEVPEPTRISLSRLRPDRIVVLGGTAVVSQAVASRLGSYTFGDVDRHAGQERFATAAAIAREAFPGAENTVHLTTGFAFPDALAGGVAAGMAGAPLLTVDPRCVPDVVLAEIERMDPDTVVVLGGEQAVGEDAANLVACSEVEEPRATTVQTGLDTPWDLAFTPDGRTFLTERDTGRVLERTPAGGLREVIRFAVDATGEGGLLGLARSPTYDRDGWLYALYVTGSDQRIVRFDANGDRLQTLVTGLPDGGPGHGNHFAGRIAFGPDGMLHVGIGDVGQPAAAQDTSRLEGKILRYTPTGGTPADNPFGNAVWAYGFRDPQGLAWDADGRMFASEFGQNTQDEIDRVVRGGNYGWPVYEGTVRYDGGRYPEEPGAEYLPPLFTAPPSEASWSGANVLIDGAIPQWEGDLLVAALRGQRLYRLVLDGDGNLLDTEQLLVGEHGRLRHLQQAPDGSVWLLTSNCDGRDRDGFCPTGRDDRILRLGR